MRNENLYTSRQIPPLVIRWKLFKFLLGIATQILIGNVPLKATLKNLTLKYSINLKIGKGKRIFANL